MQRLVDYFTEYSQTQSAILDLLRTRIFKFVVSMLLGFSIFLTLYFLLIPVENPNALGLAFVINGTLSLLYIASLISIRFTDSSQISGHFVTAWTGIIMCTIIGITAGPIFSDSTSLILIPIGMSFALLGLQGGLSWGALFILTMVVMSVSSLLGNEFPHLLKIGDKGRNQLIIWCIIFTFVISLFMAYEWALQELIHERGGNYSILHKEYDERQRTDEIIQANIIETFIHSAIQRNDNYHDKVMLMVVQLGSQFEDIETAIKLTAQQLQDTVRKIDTVARISENEICVVFENLHSVEGGDHIIEFFTQNLQFANMRSSGSSSSLNIRSAVYPDQAKSHSALLQLLWHGGN